MQGRFPLLTDENIPGPVVDALRSAGWDVLPARELFGEQTDDDHAARADDAFQYPVCYLKPRI